jgi:hypothetical protein
MSGVALCLTSFDQQEPVSALMPHCLQPPKTPDSASQSGPRDRAARHRCQQNFERSKFFLATYQLIDLIGEFAQIMPRRKKFWRAI